MSQNIMAVVVEITYGGGQYPFLFELGWQEWILPWLNYGYLTLTWSTYKTLKKKVNEDWHVVIESLEAIWIALLAHKDAIVNLTANDHTLTHVEFHMETLFDTLPPHKWCRFISIAKYNGLYLVFFFTLLIKLMNLSIKQLVFLIFKHPTMPHKNVWNDFA